MKGDGTTWVPLTQIGEFLGHDVHPGTTHRWRLKGVIHNGERIKLAVRKIGSRFFTSEEAVRTFIERLNTVANEPAIEVRHDTDETSKLLDKFDV